jgi:hypothetical protein
LNNASCFRGDYTLSDYIYGAFLQLSTDLFRHLIARIFEIQGHCKEKKPENKFLSNYPLLMPADCTEEHKQKPCKEHAPYQPRKPKAATVTNVPKTSAQPLKSHTHSNLTLNNGLIVIAYVDKHLDLSQDAITKHFSECPEAFSFLISPHSHGNSEIERS